MEVVSFLFNLKTKTFSLGARRRAQSPGGMPGSEGTSPFGGDDVDWGILLFFWIFSRFLNFQIYLKFFHISYKIQHYNFPFVLERWRANESRAVLSVGVRAPWCVCVRECVWESDGRWMNE